MYYKNIIYPSPTPPMSSSPLYPPTYMFFLSLKPSPPKKHDNEHLRIKTDKPTEKEEKKETKHSKQSKKYTKIWSVFCI